MPSTFLIKYARVTLAVLYFWFGILKVIGVSPASPLVSALLGMTMPFIPESVFIPIFGALEVILGFMFLKPKLTKITLILFWLHIFTTTLPLLLVPREIWTGFLVPNLEGQYIIKNMALIGLALILREDYKNKQPAQKQVSTSFV